MFLKPEQVTSCAVVNGVLCTNTEKTCLHNKTATLLLTNLSSCLLLLQILALFPMNQVTEISSFNASRRLDLEEGSSFVNYGEVPTRRQKVSQSQKRKRPERITYSLIHSRSWALLEKLSIVQLLKNFPALYGTRRFITVFTRAIHWSLFWARSIYCIPYHPILSL
jgi:hypothetical protein